MGPRSNPFRTRSIRGQIILLIAALALPLVGLQIWYGVSEYREAEAAADDEALVLADATAASIRQFLTLTEEILSSIAADFGPAWMGGAPCGPVATGASDYIPFLVNTAAVRGNGEILCSARPVTPGTSAESWAWLPELLETGRFTVGSPVLGTISDQWVLPVAVPIRGGDGRVEGALMGSIPLVEFSPFLEGLGLDEGHLVTIATRERVVIARSHDAQRWVGEVLPSNDGFDEEISPGRQIARGGDFEGVQRIWGQVELGNGWMVYVGLPTAAVLAPARAAVFRHLGSTLLVVLLVALFSGSSYRRIAGALRELAAGTRRTRDGAPIPLPDATPTEFQAVVEQFNRELESRRRAEAAERSARERYQSIFDNAVFGLCVSRLDGTLREANHSLASMLGYHAPAALVDGGPGSLYLFPEVGVELMDLAAREGLIENRETEWLSAEGVPITVRLSGRLIHESDGEPALELIVQDITEERRREAELRQTQKMEAIGKLAGGIAHDFNNLLTVIGGNLELMEAELAEDHSIRQDVEQIREATRRASTLTAQLLAFARREPQGARPVQVNEILTDVERLLGRLIGEDVALETRLGPDLPALLIDPGELEQIIMNLVLNARDAMPSGGRIVIETRRGSLPRGAVAAEQASEAVVLRVRDDGVGMDEDTVKRIFEPFYTTKPTGQGTGLGLSTVYGIVQRAGGGIEVDSTPGRGTTVCVRLPVTRGAVDGPLDEAEDVVAPGGRERVLVVEDEELVRGFVRRALEGAGYEILLAEDGQDALDVMGASDAPVDLVLTDVVMPRLNGTELAERIAGLAPGVPVLFMSGYLPNHTLSAHLWDNPELLLRKPFTSTELRTRVRLTLDRSYAARP